MSLTQIDTTDMASVWQAYRKLAIQYHPDKNAGNKQAGNWQGEDVTV